MGTLSKPSDGGLIIHELKEFASFPASTQRYIRRSLDIALNRGDPLRLWARDAEEMESIRDQARLYDRLPEIRAMVPDESVLQPIEGLMAPLMAITAFDLGEGRLQSFGAYRFLYERLLGAAVRPWLPAAYCGVAALPMLQPELRLKLLTSISEQAAGALGWSQVPAQFYPEWVNKAA